MSSVIAVTTDRFAQEVLEASAEVPVLVDFWAAWCGPCRTLAPVLEKLAAETGAKLKVVKVDTDAEPALASRFAIRSIPAVKLFRNGRVVAETTGAQPLQAMRAFVAPHIPKDGADLIAEARALRRRGQHAAALALLAPLRGTQDTESAAELAACLALTGSPAEANAALDALSPVAQSDPAVHAGRALVRFAGIAASPDETDAIQSARVTAARALLRDDLDAGLEALLGAAQRNRRYATGEGRTDVLAAFSLFAPDDARLAVARRRFAALLH